jgi:hypothetical protein
MLTSALWPVIEDRGINEDGFTIFRITMSDVANIIGAAMCGDLNASFHTGTGVLQTLTLVGMCSAVISRFRPGYALAKIQPDIAFKNTVRIGSSVTMQMKELKARAGISIVELRGHIEETNLDVFTPRTLTMVKI